MDGHGRYQFASGAVYIGDWKEGKMHGFGKMIYADGTNYDGQWENNLMHGQGAFVDTDRIVWQGIFAHGSYESKIQKKLKVEKEITDRIAEYCTKAITFFTSFAETFGRSDKKTYKDNLSPFFATPDTCIDYVSEPYARYEERPPEKWNELLKAIYNEGNVKISVLRSKEKATVLRPETILIEQMRTKKGGQIVEIEAIVADKPIFLAICELPAEQWVLLYCGDRAN